MAVRLSMGLISRVCPAERCLSHNGSMVQGPRMGQRGIEEREGSWPGEFALQDAEGGQAAHRTSGGAPGPLQAPAVLYVEITVDEGDGQGRWLDVEDLDPAESQGF